MGNHNQSYRTDIQFLRGISVVVVILYHLQVSGFDNGYLGVDIFFVLSGFLMAKLTDRVSPIIFFKKRFKRLVPAYLVTVFFTSLIVICITSPVDANQRIDRILFDLFALSNFAFWYENSYFSSLAFKPLLNLWSLGIEIQFYIIAPFILPFLKKKKIILFMFIVGSFIASLILLTVSPKTSFFMLPTRVWEFLFGAVAAWFFVGRKFSDIIEFLQFLSIIIIASVIMFYPLPNDSQNILTGHPGPAALLVVLATTILIVAKNEKLNNINGIFMKGFIKLGDYSYSIYLTHFPIIVLVNYSPFGGTKLGFDNLWSLSAIVILTTISSYVLYNYVERLRYKENIKFSVIGIAISCVMLSLYGSYINSLKYTKKELSIYKAWEDRDQYRCGKINRIINPTSKICKLGEVASNNRVLLLGNSHADSLKAVFVEIMNKKGISTYFYVANNPLMSKKHNEHIVANELLRKKIETVVIHFSTSFFNINENRKKLNSFLKLMNEVKIDVFFIAPVPNYKVHLPKSLLKQLSDSKYQFPTKYVSEYYSDNSDFFKFINNNFIDDFFIFYPHLIMCPKNKCKYQDESIPYYFDGGHLTLTGARSLSSLFDKLTFILEK
tara:strand:+ start:197 stop:2023 length:1827 start_codon:yes stop_codon:yes gene_type:complete